MYPLKEKHIDGYLFSTDPAKLDVETIYQFISERSYWAKGIPMDVLKRSIENSLCFGIYKDDRQVGFARLITDLATFAYLGDVFIDEAHRGKGLSKRLMEFMQAMDELKSLRRMILVTRDAHALYSQFGFKPLATPDKYMELHRPDVYKPTVSTVGQLKK